MRLSRSMMLSTMLKFLLEGFVLRWKPVRLVVLDALSNLNQFRVGFRVFLFLQCS